MNGPIWRTITSIRGHVANIEIGSEVLNHFLFHLHYFPQFFYVNPRRIVMLPTTFLIFAFSLCVVAEHDKSSWALSKLEDLAPLLNPMLNGSEMTPQILQTFLEPLQANLARNSPIYRNGTSLQLLGDNWTASGANVYWLGLDENVIPPAGEPFYAPFNASYPTKGRITEVMATLVAMGAKLIRSQTLGVSVGNPLSLMPSWVFLMRLLLNRWIGQFFRHVNMG